MIKKLIYISVLCTLLISCATTGITSKAIGAWVYDEPPVCTLKLGRIHVDKSASYSVEREIAVLLPLLFLEERIVFQADGNQADYVVDVHASERDCASGWNVRKSLSLEIYLRRNNEAREAENAVEQPDKAPGKNLVITPSKKTAALEVVTPDAAARIRASGKLGFSSSKNLEYLLGVCVKNAAVQLSRIQSGNNK
jgi:hypothetical protein